MKNQKGITLIALAIYIAVFTLIIGMLSTLTSFFYNNIINFDETTKSYAEINKFNMYFLQDIKGDVEISNFEKDGEDKIGISLYNTKTYESNIYKFEKEKKSIYRNGVLVCKNIKDFKISNENNKYLDIYIQTEGAVGVGRTTSYAINN